MAFPTTSLKVRYEAKLDTGHVDGESLGTIEDQTATAWHMVQATAARQPTYRTGVVNTEPAYRVDGVDDWARSPNPTAWAPAAFSLTLVASSGATEATARTWSALAYNGTTDLTAFVEGVTSGEAGTFYRTSTGTVQQVTAGVDTTAWAVYTIVWDGATVYYYRNGTLIDSDALAGVLSLESIAIGAHPDLGEYWSGDIALSAYWEVALDATARADLHTYVQDTYGITVSDYSGGGGVTGTGSPSLGALTASGTGTVAVAGTGSPSLPSLTASGSGAVQVSGTGTGTLPSLTGSGTSTVTITGTGSPSLPSLTGTGSGTVSIVGTGSVTLPLLIATGSGAVVVSGSGTGTLPALTASGSQTALVAPFTGTASISAAYSGTGSIAAVYTGTPSLEPS